MEFGFSVLFCGMVKIKNGFRLPDSCFYFIDKKYKILVVQEEKFLTPHILDKANQAHNKLFCRLGK